jgi:spermidine synthase
MIEKPLPTNWIIASIIALGIAEILTQLVVMREFLSAFYGNELVIGILLANWLLIGGIGSYLGTRVVKILDKQRILILFHVLIAFILPASILIIRNLYNFAFIRGELVGVTQVFIAAFLILLPICLITGFSLPLFSVLYSRKQHASQVGSVYFFDSLSNIIGGAVFSFVLIYFLTSFQVAIIVLIINLAFAAVLSIKCRRYVFAALAAVLLVAAFISSLFVNLESISVRQQYPGQNIVLMEDSVYGRLVVTADWAQLNFFKDGMPMFSTDSPQVNEEKVHYAMLQHPDPKTVLLISGGISGTTDELLKYNLTSIDYVELDPVLIKVGREYTSSLDDPRVRVRNIDARLFVRQSTVRYDVVIIDSPEPSTAQSNRYYTEEFFAELKSVMSPRGILGLHIPSGEEYMNEETRMLDAAVYNSLKKSFKNILVIPGDTAYLIASDAKLDYGYYDYLDVRGIDNVFVRKEYLKDKLEKSRIDYFNSAVSQYDVTNSDFRPVAYYYHLLYWLRQFEADYFVFIAALVLLLVLVMWRIDSVGFAVFSSGFAGISLELVILVGFQVLYGYVYGKMGVIITAFMLGLALGAFYVTKRLEKVSKRTVSLLSISIAAYSLLLPLFFYLVHAVENDAVLGVMASLIFPAITVIIGILVGALFPAASKLRFKEAGATSGRFYFYDYAGACIGAVLVTVLLIPLLGIFWTCAVIAAVAFVASVLNLKK